jgi:hypothetical protein
LEDISPEVQQQQKNMMDQLGQQWFNFKYSKIQFRSAAGTQTAGLAFGGEGI